MMVQDEICPTCGNEFHGPSDARLAHLEAIEAAVRDLSIDARCDQTVTEILALITKGMKDNVPK